MNAEVFDYLRGDGSVLLSRATNSRKTSAIYRVSNSEALPLQQLPFVLT